MGTQTSLAGLAGLLASLQPQLSGLKKYETSFPASSQQLLQRTLKNAETVQALLAAVAQDGEDTTGILGYLRTGRALGPLKTATTELQTNMNGIVAGSMQVPRNAKEGLSTLRLQLLGVKIELPAEQQRLAEQLDKLCEELGKHSPGQDIDVAEAQLDGLTKQLLQQVHATDSLESEALGKELAALEAGVAAAKAGGRDAEAQFYSLVLNSLQRLHASQMQLDESDDDPSDPEEPADVDEDEDDPFYMPMPGAIKWADDRKFSMLAQPLGPEQPESKQFMIMMETDGEAPAEDEAAAAERASTGAAHGAAAAAAAEAAEADDAGSETPAEAASAAEQLDALPAPGEDAAKPGSARVSANGKVSASGRVASASGAAAAAAAAGGALVEAEPAAEGAAENAGTPDQQPQQEKLRQFVNFLSGENPGACMFHAQMRLSVEGCIKLANFLKSSARVRALSLSHNYLGDEGLGLICQGLKVNKSVTALDLPDNNIGDQGIIYLVDAIKDNPSLTQLQLAYNKIGDQGAAALAKVIASSNSLKKLGLSFNAIGRPGCQALIHAISNNQSLKHLQILPGNPVEEKDAKALAKALKRNKKFSIRTFLGIGE